MALSGLVLNALIALSWPRADGENDDSEEEDDKHDGTGDDQTKLHWTSGQKERLTNKETLVRDVRLERPLAVGGTG